jgi:ribosomal protein L14
MDYFNSNIVYRRHNAENLSTAHNACQAVKTKRAKKGFQQIAPIAAYYSDDCWYKIYMRVLSSI